LFVSIMQSLHDLPPMSVQFQSPAIVDRHTDMK
jgi:hypothetical protein